MKGRRLGMQGHHPRSSAAFLHGQALSCFSREECSVAHVLRIARRSVKHSIFKDTAADPFHGSCVHRHGALNRFFSLLEVHVCGSPAVEACFDARFSENVFCELCIGVSFFLRFMQWMRVPPFSYFCVQWMRVPSFFYARHSSGLRRAR